MRKEQHRAVTRVSSRICPIAFVMVCLPLNCDRLWNFGGLRAFSFGLLDVDTALEEGAIFNADAGCSHVAGQRAFGANVDTIGGSNIAADLSKHDDFAGVDGGIDLPVAAHREAVAGQVDSAFDFAINIE